MLVDNRPIMGPLTLPANWPQQNKPEIGSGTIKAEFTIKTKRGTYECYYTTQREHGEIGDGAAWKISAKFGEDSTALFYCPANWSRIRVFQFINSIDENFQ